MFFLTTSPKRLQNDGKHSCFGVVKGASLN